MECPDCKLINPPGSVCCDCGYDFEQRKQVPRGRIAGSPRAVSDKDGKSFQWLAGVVWAMSLGNACAAFGLSESPILIGLISVWMLVFMCALVRYERRALWLLPGALFGVVIPLLIHVIAAGRRDF
jgi:hypothetical protein